MSVLVPENDQDYQDWIKCNAVGFVVNTKKNPSPDYMVLHKHTCLSINELASVANEDAFTQNSYIKICSDSIKNLRVWVSENGRPNGTFSKECQICDPLNPMVISHDTAKKMMSDYNKTNGSSYPKNKLIENI